MLSSKNLLYGIFSLSLGWFLIWLILRFTPVSIEQIINQLQHLNLFYVSLVIISTFTHLWITAYKWKLITRKLTSNYQTSQNFYLIYIVFANLIAQFVPQQIGLTFVQSLALKFHKVSSLSQGFFSVVYDQFFNILIPLLLLPPSLLLLLGKIPLSVAIFASLGILLLVHCFILKWHKPFILWLFKTYDRVKIAAGKKSAQTGMLNDVPVLSTRFTVRLFWLSVLRHANWMLRSFFVVMAGGLAIQFWAIAFTTNLVQTAMIVSITPANLGFMEWSWIGGLKLLGVPAVVAGNFAFLQRILGIFSIILIAVFCWFMFILDRSLSATVKNNKL